MNGLVDVLALMVLALAMVALLVLIAWMVTTMARERREDHTR